MIHEGIELHNVATARRVEDGEGRLLQRVPEAVRTELNDGAQTRMCHPTGVELRFVPDGTARVTLSTRPHRGVREGTVRIFWGPFQSTQTAVVGPEPTTIEVSLPERLTHLEPDVVEGFAFDPCVCRLRLPGEHRGGHVVYHGVEGAVRPPASSELPDRRYLAYGTSITEGVARTGEHLTYVSQAARRLGADPINLGSCGTAFCDAAMAEHVADRDDWDVATLALSLNMVAAFSVEAFRERASAMVETIAGANPESQVACLTLFPHEADVCGDADEAARSEAFRDALRDVVGESPLENVHLIEGAAVLPGVAGLTPDLAHPGDDGHIRMGERLAERLEPLLE